MKRRDVVFIYCSSHAVGTWRCEVQFACQHFCGIAGGMINASTGTLRPLQKTILIYLIRCIMIEFAGIKCIVFSYHWNIMSTNCAFNVQYSPLLMLCVPTINVTNNISNMIMFHISLSLASTVIYS